MVLGNYDPSAQANVLLDTNKPPVYSNPRALTAAIDALLTTITDINALATISRTSSAWDPYNKVIVGGGVRRQRPLTIRGTTYQMDLCENSRTNILAAGSSERFNITWTLGAGNPTVTTKSAASPLATENADKFIEGTTNGAQVLAQSVTKAASSLAYALSVYVKNASGTRDLRLQLDDGTGANGMKMVVTPSTGALKTAPTTIGSGWSANTTAGTSGYLITDEGGGWYRVSLIVTTDTSTTIRIGLDVENAGSISYAGDGTSGFYLWGAQLEQATFSSSYISLRNVVSNTEALNSWTKTRSTVTSDTIANPLTGLLTADKIVEDNTASNTHFIITAGTKPGSALTYTGSLYGKAGERTWIAFSLADGSVGTNQAGAYFDLGNGVTGSNFTTGSGVSVVSKAISSVGNGWYRCSIVITMNTTTVVDPIVYLATGDTVRSYSGNATSGAYVWGVQVEPGTGPIGYWGNGTVGVRNADNLQATLTSITDSRTNLLTWSEQFDNAAWTKTDVTVTANTGTDPNGNGYCDLLTEGTAGTAFTSSSSATITANTTVALSWWFKASANNSWVRVAVLSNSSTNGWRAWFNLNTGVVGSTTVLGTGTASSITIESFGNGWYRCKTTGKVDPAATTCIVTVGSADADGSTTRINNSAYYAFGASLEQASSVGTYIPTGSTAISTGPTGLSRTAGTLMALVMPRNWTGDQDGSTQWFASRDSSGTLSQSFARAGAAAFFAIRGDTAGNQGNSSVHSLAHNTLSLLGGTWTPAAVKAQFNGTDVSSDTSLAAPFNAVTTEFIGSQQAPSNHFFGYVWLGYVHGGAMPAADQGRLFGLASAP